MANVVRVIRNRPLRRLVAFALLISLMAGCAQGGARTGGDGVSSAPAPGSQSQSQTGPKLDATLTVVLESAPPHLDNQLTLARLGRTVTDPVNVFLVRFDDKMNLKPYLATRWEQPDSTTYRFTLHQGVKFHNGRELTADDVKSSVERVLDVNAGSPLRADFAVVDKVTALNKHEVEFKLKSSFAPFMSKLAYLPIIPIEVVKAQGDMKKAPVGAGPYKFVEWKQDQQIVLERFDDFFLKDEIAKNKRLVFKFFPEYTAGISAVETGAADVHLWMKVTDIDRLKNSKDLKLVPNNLQGHYFLGFNMARKPWQDERLRQAVQLGVDRQAILQVAFGGQGKVTSTALVPKTFWDDPSYEVKRDVEKAKALVKDAGFSGEYTLLAPNTPIEGPLGQIVQSQLAAIGMNVKLQVLEVPAFLERTYTRKDFDLMVIGNAYADPDDIYSNNHHSKGSRNIFGYANPQLDSLIEKAVRTLDPNERKQLYVQVNQTLLKDAPVVYLASETRMAAIRSNVSGVVLKPNNTYEFHRAEIR